MTTSGILDDVQTGAGENQEQEGALNVGEVISLSLDEFLSRYEMNKAIKRALEEFGIFTVELLLECDTNDITAISKTFSKYKDICVQDKLKFRRTMKTMIQQIENNIIIILI